MGRIWFRLADRRVLCLGFAHTAALNRWFGTFRKKSYTLWCQDHNAVLRDFGHSLAWPIRLIHRDRLPDCWRPQKASGRFVPSRRSGRTGGPVCPSPTLGSHEEHNAPKSPHRFRRWLKYQCCLWRSLSIRAKHWRFRAEHRLLLEAVKAEKM